MKVIDAIQELDELLRISDHSNTPSERIRMQEKYLLQGEMEIKNDIYAEI